MIVIKYIIISSLIFFLIRSITKPFVSSVKDAYLEGKAPPQNVEKKTKKSTKNSRKFMGGEEIEFEEVD